MMGKNILELVLYQTKWMKEKKIDSKLAWAASY